MEARRKHRLSGSELPDETQPRIKALVENSMPDPDKPKIDDEVERKLAESDARSAAGYADAEERTHKMRTIAKKIKEKSGPHSMSPLDAKTKVGG